jgi:hypothetical protein
MMHHIQQTGVKKRAVCPYESDRSSVRETWFLAKISMLKRQRLLKQPDFCLSPDSSIYTAVAIPILVRTGYGCETPFSLNAQVKSWLGVTSTDPL